MGNIIEINGIKYKQVEQPKESYEDNPCWDCVFGIDGECCAPIGLEEFDDSLDHQCGFRFRGTQYIYVKL